MEKEGNNKTNSIIIMTTAFCTAAAVGSYMYRNIVKNATSTSSSSTRSTCKKMSSSFALDSSSRHNQEIQNQPAQKNQEQRREFTSINAQTPYNLCFLRHGQSTWNRDNRFIGWTDTPLTDDGVLEARVAGKMLKNSGILFDEVHTSLLRRCIRTTNLVLMEMEQEYIPVLKVSRKTKLLLVLLFYLFLS
jgi:hypothetical protein